MTHEEFVQRETDAAFRAVLATVDGKRVLFSILTECAIYVDAFKGERGATDYTLGQQSIGRRLIERFDGLDPLVYPRLLMDMAEIRSRDEAAASRSAANESEDDAP